MVGTHLVGTEALAIPARLVGLGVLLQLPPFLQVDGWKSEAALWTLEDGSLRLDVSYLRETDEAALHAQHIDPPASTGPRLDRGGPDVQFLLENAAYLIKRRILEGPEIPAPEEPA